VPHLARPDRRLRLPHQHQQRLPRLREPLEELQLR